jgi:DNA replication protein DnaC
MELKHQLAGQLHHLRLSGVLETLEARNRQAIEDKWSFVEFLSRILEDEVERRTQKQLSLRIRRGALNSTKTLEGFDFDFNLNLNRQQILELATCEFIHQKRNLLICGPTGVGKTFLISALGLSACRADYSVRYFLTSRLLYQLAQSHQDGSFPALLASLAKLDLLILDDWMRDPISAANAQDLLEVLDDRFGRVSTLVASQVPVADWFARFPDPTIGDGVLDRVVHNAYRLNLSGDSLRKTRSAVLMAST